MNPIISALFGVINGPLDALLSRFFPSAEEKQKAMLEIQLEVQKQQDAIVNATMAAAAAQIDVNKVEAANSSVFVAGWRPAIGWTCGFALAYQFVLQPIIGYGLTVYSTYSHQVIPPIPTLDTGSLMTVLLGMLGLTAARTVEKLNGVSRDTITEPSKPTA